MSMAAIRTADPSDVDAIAHVHVDSWLTTYRGLMPDSVLDHLSLDGRRDWWKGVILQHGRQVAVAEDNDKIVGFAYFGEEREKDPLYRGELYAIYLLAGHQQQGLGRLLVKATAQGLLELGMDKMLVWVLSTNPARRFYEKLGGVFLRDKPLEIGGTMLQETAYGWDDIHSLAVMK
jgi:L-amino acid N-acyltransferase YncA